MTASLAKTITEADVYGFAGISLDTNPAHVNEEWASETRFKGRIAHGLISAGLISAIFGTRLPGYGTIYVNQTLKFRAPVHFGDTVTAKVELTRLIPEKKFAVFDTRCFVGDKAVLEGEGTVMVPSREG